MSRVLVVGSFPPDRCGIAQYARQQVDALRAAGDDVCVLTWAPGEGDRRASLNGWLRPLRLIRHARGFDRVVVNHEPGLFQTGGGGPVNALAWVAVNAAVPRLEYIAHELRDPATVRGGAIGRWLERLRWRTAPVIVVHTRAEADRLQHEVGGLDARRLRVRDHGADFVRRFDGDRTAARARLDLPASAPIVLCIGFIQQHKGFERVVDAFAAARRPAEARLYVVGSARVDSAVPYLEGLRRSIAEVPGAELREGYVDDQAFDAWVAAADAVVLPYRVSWSSGVAERARLYGTPLIVTDAGGLGEQARGGRVVRDDAELRSAVEEVCAGLRTGGPGAEPPPPPRRPPPR